MKESLFPLELLIGKVYIPASDSSQLGTEHTVQKDEADAQSTEHNYCDKDDLSVVLS